MTGWVALMLQLNVASAADWWVEEPATAEVLVETLAELWPGAHEVRIGGGDGFVLRHGLLTWVGDVETRAERVDGPRAAVVLARSWDQRGETASVGWVPEDARALPPRSDVELGDLDSRTPAGVAYLGGVVDLRYGLGFGVAVRREGTVRVGARAVLTPAFWWAPDDVGSDGLSAPAPGMVAFDLQSFADWDAVPGPMRLALGGAVASHHQDGGVAGMWIAARPLVELGVDVASTQLAAHLSHSIVLARGGDEAMPLPGTRVGAVLRRSGRVPFDVAAGYGGFHGEPEVWIDFQVFMDLGGWR